MEQNIDAYRIVSEILGDLRRAIRDRLESAYGDTWYRDGLPKEVFDRLVAAKEREKAIDWYEGQYQQIMEYAVFADLVEILEKNAGDFSELMALAPNSALLQARFIELDVMRAKLGRARPISETELSFLGTFHLRFRKAIADMPAPEPPPHVEPSPEEEPDEEIVAPEPTPKRRASDRPPKQEPVVPPPELRPKKPKAEEPTPPPTVPRKPQKVVGRPMRPVAAVDHNDEDDDDKAPSRAPVRAVQSASAQRRIEKDEEPEQEFREPEGEAETDIADGDDAPNTRAPVGPKKLADALENNDHRAVLRELYREVTTVAESVWSSDVTPAPLVWEQVTASEWYKNNFSRLGLQPLSVFYEVTGNVEQMAREGSTKKQLQEFLKETNFAKTLLALRDMFQANNL
jgi:hypothetical protein